MGTTKLFFFGDGHHKKNILTLLTPKVFPPNIKAYDQISAQLYRSQVNNARQTIWDKVRSYWEQIGNLRKMLGFCLEFDENTKKT